MIAQKKSFYNIKNREYRLLRQLLLFCFESAPTEIVFSQKAEKTLDIIAIV